MPLLRALRERFYCYERGRELKERERKLTMRWKSQQWWKTRIGGRESTVVENLNSRERAGRCKFLYFTFSSLKFCVNYLYTLRPYVASLFFFNIFSLINFSSHNFNCELILKSAKLYSLTNFWAFYVFWYLYLSIKLSHEAN